MRHSATAQLLALISVACISTVSAADAPDKLVFETAKFDLTGPRAEQRLVVSGQFGEHLRDVTDDVEYSSSNPQVVVIKDGIARPVADGTATLSAKIVIELRLQTSQ